MRVAVCVTCLVLAAALVLSTQVPVARADSAGRVVSLPGFDGSLPFTSWTGFINVTDEHSLFFWFVEAESDAMNKDVVVWFSGGPGCSSLFALLTEHGPVYVKGPDLKLGLREYSWHKQVNMVYVEAPICVGFSEDLTGKCQATDASTAQDNFGFVVGFHKLFNQFKGGYWIAGESYAGHYVPQLMDLLVNSSASPPLRGMLAGNPSTDHYSDYNNYWPFMHSHALVSDETWAEADVVCGGNFANPSPACASIIDEMRSQLGNLNPYNIYAQCNARPSDNGGCLTQQMAEQVFVGSPATDSRPVSQTFVPCIDLINEVKYMNQPALQRALGLAGNATWDVCSDTLQYSGYASTMLPIYERLATHPLHILVFSGDVDSCVPYAGTQAAIDALGMKVRKPWRNYQAGGQLAGFYKVFDTPNKQASLTYATIKGSGHMAATYKPQATFTLITSFINGTLTA